MIVIDASVAASWIFPNEEGPELEGLLSKYDVILAPILFWSEIRNVLLMGERKGLISENVSSQAISSITHLNIELDNNPSSDDVMRLARLHGLSVYDALYLELAKRRTADLATLDKKLRAAAAQEDLNVVD